MRSYGKHIEGANAATASGQGRNWSGYLMKTLRQVDPATYIALLALLIDSQRKDSARCPCMKFVCRLLQSTGYVAA